VHVNGHLYTRLTHSVILRTDRESTFKTWWQFSHFTTSIPKKEAHIMNVVTDVSANSKPFQICSSGWDERSWNKYLRNERRLWLSSVTAFAIQDQNMYAYVTGFVVLFCYALGKY